MEKPCLAVDDSALRNSAERPKKGARSARGVLAKVRPNDGLRLYLHSPARWPRLSAFAMPSSPRSPVPGVRGLYRHGPGTGISMLSSTRWRARRLSGWSGKWPASIPTGSRNSFPTTNCWSA